MNGMIYMALFWVFFIIFLISALIIFFIKIDRRKKEKLSDLYFFTLIMMGLTFFMVIATKDPFLEWLPIFNAIQESGWEVALSVFIFGIALFLSWVFLRKEYLKPFREDIGNLKTEVGKVDERTKDIQKDVSWIKENCKISFKK